MALQGTTNHALEDRVFDSGLSILDTEVDKIVLCSASPTTYTEANTTYKLAEKTSYAIGSPANRSGGGREVTAPAVSGGTITSAGTATHAAYVDTVNTRLLAVRQLSSSVALASPGTNTWSCSSHKMGIPAPT
jgi:hypothetical protein